MRWHTVTKLGPHTSLTPEGYLLAEGVPVARCGSQIYHHSELPLEPNDDGLVHVFRDPTEVFRPESVASFNAKPIVNDHPYQEVGPSNWNSLAVGVMVNPRRGTGKDDDVLLADLLFTTPAGIDAVKNGKRAVSVGYDAYYEQTARGMGRQKNIVCNHLALVDVARCGPRCSILDSGMPLYNDAWREADHPREDDGKFGEGGGGGGATTSWSVSELANAYQKAQTKLERTPEHRRTDEQKMEVRRAFAAYQAAKAGKAPQKPAQAAKPEGATTTQAKPQAAPAAGKTPATAKPKHPAGEAVENGLRKALPALKHFKTEQDSKGNTWVSASTKTWATSGRPITLPGEPGSAGVAVKLDHANKRAHFYELNNGTGQKGLGSKMVAGVMGSIPKDYQAAVHVDLSEGFWEHIKQRYPDRFADGVRGFLRRLFSADWFATIDYDPHEDVDFRDDDWNEALHPRVPGGSASGGQFTSGGGGGGGITSGLPSGGFATSTHGTPTASYAQSVPTPKAAVVQKHGGSKKLAKLVAEHLAMGEDPHITAQAVKEYGNNKVNAGYASYSNALLKHIEEAHGLAPGTLGKSKAAPPMGGGGAQGPQAQPPTEQEMEQWAASQEQAAETGAAEAEQQAATTETTAASQEAYETKAWNASGTSPGTLATVAKDPIALDQLSNSAHKLGILTMGTPTPEATGAKAAISTWTDPAGYKMLNNHMNGTATNSQAASIADELQKAILSTKLKADLNVYRGVHGPQLADIASKKPGDVWTQKGFTASTVDPKRATHYAKGGKGGALIHMVLPQGSKALYVSNPDLNSHTSEREMLLPAGSTFKYLGSQTIDLPQYDYSGNKTGPGGPTVVHQVEVMQPGSPEFEAAHPRGEGGKFVAKPGTDVMEEAKQPAAEPDEVPFPLYVPEPQTKTQQSVKALFDVTGLTPQEKIEEIQKKLDNMTHPPNIAYAQKAIEALKAEGEKPEWMQTLFPEPAAAAPPEAGTLGKQIDIIMGVQGLPASEKKAAILNLVNQNQLAPQAGHDYAAQKIAELNAQEPAQPEAVPASAVESIVNDPATTFVEKKNLLTELQVAAENAGHDYSEVTKAFEQLKPPGPDPYPGSKGQEQIFQIAQSTMVNNATKIEGIKGVMIHPNAGPMTQEFGQKWIEALGGDPNEPLPPPTTAPAPTPTPAAKPAPAPAPAKPKKSVGHYKSEAKHYYEDAKGDMVAANFVADTKKIPGDYYQKVTDAYAADPSDGNTYAVCQAMQDVQTTYYTQRTPSQRKWLTEYKGTFYHDINNYFLGKGGYQAESVPKAIKEIRNRLKTEVVPATTPAYRGLRASLQELTGFDDPEQAVGRAFVHRNFASISRDISTAESFAQMGSHSTNSTLMHVVVPAGTPGIVLGDQGKFSEQEIVLPDHCVFRIDKVENNPKGSASKHTIHCTLMGTTEAKDVGQSVI